MPRKYDPKATEPLRESPDRLLNRMAEPFRFTPDQSIECSVFDRCSAAVVGFGNEFAFLKPAAAKRDCVLLVMDGEVGKAAAYLLEEQA